MIKLSEKIKNSEIYINAVKIIEILSDAGFESYIVGGAVRDLLIEKNPKEYDRLYDINLSLIRDAIVRLFNSDIKKTKKFIKSEILKTQLKTPFIKVKATTSTAYVDNTYDQLSAGLEAATSIVASPGRSKQEFI